MAAAMDVLTIGTAVHGTIRPQDKMPEPDELDSDEPMRLEEELLIQEPLLKNDPAAIEHAALDFLKRIKTGQEKTPLLGPDGKVALVVPQEFEEVSSDSDIDEEMSKEVKDAALDFLVHIRIQPQTDTELYIDEKTMGSTPNKDSPNSKPLDPDETHGVLETMKVYHRGRLGKGAFREVIDKSSAFVHVTSRLHSLMALSSQIRYNEDNDEEETLLERQRIVSDAESDIEVSFWNFIPFWPWGNDDATPLDNYLDPTPGEAPAKKKGTSYKILLDEPTRLYVNLENEDGVQDPFLLDDPELRHGKDQAVLRFPGWTVSVIPFVNEKDLKKELNEQFMLEHEEDFPDLLHSGLSLSKVRNIKRTMVATAAHFDLEVSTVALAELYLDLLILKGRDKESASQGATGVVTKENRRLYASVCLLLATKYNDPKAETRGTIRQLLDLMEQNFQIPVAEVLKHEFDVFVDLNFGLHAHPNLVNDIFERLLKNQELSAQEYLEDMYEDWEDDTVFVKNVKLAEGVQNY